MIDAELQTIGRAVKLLFRPNKLSFKGLDYVSRLTVGQNISGFDSSTVNIKSSCNSHSIRTRVYKPKQVTENLPVLLYLHGGGYAFGCPESTASCFKPLLRARDCIVVAPDYTKSLAAPYPAAVNDCYDALLWIKDNAQTLGARDDQIIVGGPSAGGGLTLAVCLMARDRGSVNIAFQLPIYPMIDDRQNLPSAIGNTAPVWNSKLNDYAWSLYLKPLQNSNADIPAYAAPARAESFAELPPTISFVGDQEPFLDETKLMIERMSAEGVPTVFEIFEGAYHAFEMLAPQAKISKAAVQFLQREFVFALDKYFAPQNEKLEA